MNAFKVRMMVLRGSSSCAVKVKGYVSMHPTDTSGGSKKKHTEIENNFFFFYCSTGFSSGVSAASSSKTQKLKLSVRHRPPKNTVDRRRGLQTLKLIEGRRENRVEVWILKERLKRWGGIFTKLQGVPNQSWSRMGDCRISNEHTELEFPRIVTVSRLDNSHLKEIHKNLFGIVFFLMETKQRKDLVVDLQVVLGYDRVFTVEPVSLSGGLALMWSNKVNLVIQFADMNLIDVEVTLAGVQFYMSFIYGEPSHRGKEIIL